MYNIIQEQLFKAHRIVKGLDMYEPMAPILRSLWRDKDIGRVGDVKPGERNIYDNELRGPHSKFF